MDRIIRLSDKAGHLRVFSASTTQLVEKARSIHNTSPVATAALGRMLTANSMMGITLKGINETISLQIRSDGPIESIVTVSDCFGNVRGYVGNADVDIPLKYAGKLDVGTAVGKGYLTVVRDMKLKEPYVGRIALSTGEIAEDIAAYYATSEQIPSVVALGVLVDTDRSVKAAGGYIIQLMPDATEEDISKLEDNLSRVQPVSKMIAEGATPETLIKDILAGFELNEVTEVTPEYLCNCSRDRIEKAVISLGKEEIEKMIEEDGKAEVGCYFCGKDYKFTKEELREILHKATQN
ncbi:MAG: Hsp33 family molecular chaperone HslO [Clostridia bacterium]|nr:Hsp33 family molecular chaperone HslO [Clostridia bacterium]